MFLHAEIYHFEKYPNSKLGINQTKEDTFDKSENGNQVNGCISFQLTV